MMMIGDKSLPAGQPWEDKSNQLALVATLDGREGQLQEADRWNQQGQAQIRVRRGRRRLGKGVADKVQGQG